MKTFLFAAALLTTSTIALAGDAPQAVTIAVTADPSLGEHQSGRIIVFAKKIADPAKPDKAVGFDIFAPSASSIAAREVSDLLPGQIAIVDGETDSFPAPFSRLAPGTYELQAVLDRNHDYNYSGRKAGDLVSRVVTAQLPGPIPTLKLDQQIPVPDEAKSLSNNAPAEKRATVLEWAPRLKPVEFQSPKMTAFRGKATFIRGWIALPPGYDGKTRLPTVYSYGGFGGSTFSSKAKAAMTMADMASGKSPPMIWVYLDHNGPTGTHEFADSVNNGPWGTALTSEFIPWLETQYAMDARPSGRFLTGHSSGGWSALWLQVRYPKMFGGSWPTSPDPSDFSDFFNINIYAPNANMYRDAEGNPYPLARDNGKAFITIEEYARSEWVMGHYGGQISSLDWVFSPRGPDGRPMPLIDRATGKVDLAVAAYWRDNYDIANILRRDWPKLKRDLDGKIHLTVGGADTFYLDGPARRLTEVMKALGGKTDLRVEEGKTHFDLYERHGDAFGLQQDLAWEMYAVARPKAKRAASEASSIPPLIPAGAPARALAKAIVGSETDDLRKTRLVIDWLNANFEWTATDYQKRSVDEIITRRGGNCAEQMRVAREVLAAAGVRTRRIAEINLQPFNSQRGANAAERIKQFGPRSSVFGGGHNDHRWIEVYDSRSRTWIPADPTLGLLGVEQWVRARVGFGERPTHAILPSRDMIVPVAIFALPDEDGYANAIDRSDHYLVDGLDALYDGQLRQDSMWQDWKAQIGRISPAALAAFRGEKDLNAESATLEAARSTYAGLRRNHASSNSRGRGETR